MSIKHRFTGHKLQNNSQRLSSDHRAQNATCLFMRSREFSQSDSRFSMRFSLDSSSMILILFSPKKHRTTHLHSHTLKHRTMLPQSHSKKHRIIHPYSTLPQSKTQDNLPALPQSRTNTHFCEQQCRH